MVYQVNMFSAVCDNCGEPYIHPEGFMAFSEREQMEEALMNDEWEKQDKKHYCRDCWYVDDNDNIVCKAGDVSTKRREAQENGFDDFCSAHDIPYKNECPECKTITQ